MAISEASHAEIDYEALSEYRLARARAKLAEHGFAAGLLFDPLNVRYTTSIGIALVWNLHVSFRWALVPVESAPVVWDYDESMHVARERYAGDLRPALGWTFFGSGSQHGPRHEGVRRGDQGGAGVARAARRAPRRRPAGDRGVPGAARRRSEHRRRATAARGGAGDQGPGRAEDHPPQHARHRHRDRRVARCRSSRGGPSSRSGPPSCRARSDRARSTPRHGS